MITYPYGGGQDNHNTFISLKPTHTMKKSTNLRQAVLGAFIYIVLLVAYTTAKAQSLSIKGNVTLDNISSLEEYNVQVLNMNNDSIISFVAHKSFKYDLNYNCEYMVIVSRDGFQSKAIFFNTECKSKKKLKFLFDCNLEKDVVHDGVVCQAGGVFFANKSQEFTHYYHH